MENPTIDPNTLIQCEIDDLYIDNEIYIHGRMGKVISFDYPLIFWQFYNDDRVLHRSFISSKTIFQIKYSDRKNINISNIHSDDEDNDFEFNFPPLSNNSQPSTKIDQYNINNSTNNSTIIEHESSNNNWDTFETDFDTEIKDTVPPVLAPAIVNTPTNDLKSLVIKNSKVFCTSKRNENLTFPLVLSQSLYIEKCASCSITLPSKANSIQAIESSFLTLTFTSLISTCELTRCSVSSIHGNCSTYMIDECESLRIYFDANQDVLIRSYLAKSTDCIACDGEEQYIEKLENLDNQQYYTKWDSKRKVFTNGIIDPKNMNFMN